MKTRTGFVSNSSSTSFYVAIAPDSEADSRDEALLTALGIPPDSAGAKLFKPLVAFLAQGRVINLDSLLENADVGTLAELRKSPRSRYVRVADLLEAGWLVREVTASNEDCEGASQFFYEAIVTLDTPTCKIVER